MPPPSPILKIHHAQITVAASDPVAAGSFYSNRIERIKPQD